MPSDLSTFIDFMRRKGLAPADSREIRADDRLRRFTIQGDKPRSGNGAYKLGIIDNILIGWVRSHKLNVTYNFPEAGMKGLGLSDAEIKKLQAEMEKRKAEAEQKRKHEQDKVSDVARDAYAASIALLRPHPYTERKQINWRNLRIPGREITLPLIDRSGRPWMIGAADLLIPLYDAKGVLWNIQQINGEGVKRFLPGGRVKGLYHPIGGFRPLLDDPMMICEGWATGRTLHRVFGCPVACAIQANNLENVGYLLRKKYKYAKLIYAADNDRWTKKQNGEPDNPGIRYAVKAADSTGGSVQTLPERLGQHHSRPTDFNDMANIEGDAAVRACFAKVLA